MKNEIFDVINGVSGNVAIAFAKYARVFWGVFFGALSRLLYVAQKGKKIDFIKGVFAFIVGFGLAGMAYEVAQNLGYVQYDWAISFICGLGGENFITYLMKRFSDPEKFVTDIVTGKIGKDSEKAKDETKRKPKNDDDNY